jgi:hypothetical protein
MTACVLALGIITCTSTVPRLTPTEAARILVASGGPYVYVPPIQRDGPVVVTNRSRAGDGPWEWPKPQPARRLDGTLLTTPPTIYGIARLRGFNDYSPARRHPRGPRRTDDFRRPGLTAGRALHSSSLTPAATHTRR